MDQVFTNQNEQFAINSNLAKVISKEMAKEALLYNVNHDCPDTVTMLLGNLGHRRDYVVSVIDLIMGQLKTLRIDNETQARTKN